MKIVDVIKYEGDNSTFIWKHPAEDFNTMSQLIVHETQEAVLFLNGQALDLYGPGHYTLHTQNIPLLRRLINLPTDGESPFHCEVYFINKTEQMDIKWGMGNVNYADPQHGDYVFVIGANGTMSLRISDSRKILTKLVGTTNLLDQEMLKNYFKDPITMHLKSMLPKILREKNLSIFDVERDLTDISARLKKDVTEEMADYGVCLEKFWINAILKPENDPNYKLLNRQRGERVTLPAQGELEKQRAAYEAQADVIRYGGEVQKKKMDIETQRYEQQQLGYTYQQRRSFDVMQDVAQNEGTGSDLRNAGMGLGMGFGIGGTFGQAMGNIAEVSGFGAALGQTPPTPTAPPAPGAGAVPGMISLQEDPLGQGAAPQDPAAPVAPTAPAAPVAPAAPAAPAGGVDDFETRLQKLKMMKGELSEEAYNAKLQQLMDEI